MSASIAAAIQAWIGNVAAGSLFAAAQSAAMGGGIPFIFSVIGGAITGILGAIITAICWMCGLLR